MSEEYNYKNLIELKEDVDENTVRIIRDLCLDLYNKGEGKVELLEHSLRKFDMVTNEKGKHNLMIGVGLVVDYNIFTDNVKLWYWEEPNKFECGDILACMYEEGVLGSLKNKKAV